MKLFVYDKSGAKSYIDLYAETRNLLVENIGSQEFVLNDEVYSVSDVFAESSDYTASSMAAGGVIGVLGGVPGVVVGGLIGALLGSNSDTKDKQLAEKFNRSTL